MKMPSEANYLPDGDFLLLGNMIGDYCGRFMP